MLAAVDKRLYLPGLADGMPKPELDARLQYFFLNEEVDEVPPSTICDLASITVKQTNRHVWQASVTLTENPSVDILSELPGNNRTLTFFFRLVGQSWLIFAFGELPPQVDRIVSPEETIRDTMVACLQQFADENAEGASTFFTDPFLNTLVDEDVTQDELVATFQGYFEDYDFSSLQNQRVVFDINRSPEMKHPGGATYKVTMEFSGSADSDFPFWETLNGYYLVFDERENAWRIFAIF